jgi:UDP-N-acetylglucosamine--N-acetylmuramyl-(pentapeptide) pyrophosphoryl-undecaprenol N-acetylglucosamine transferase
VREAFFNIPAKTGGPPTLLVFGGSQGARAINQAMIESLPGLKQRVPGIHIIHQTGQRDFENVLTAYERAGMTVGEERTTTGAASLSSGGQECPPHTSEVHKFIDDMPGTFARADLLVCRSGASTVAEITAAGKPAIFVPFPRAADDHQNVNAGALERAGAAIVVEESNLGAAYLVDMIAALISDSRRLQAMSAAAKSLAHPKAVEEIAEMVLGLAGDFDSADERGSVS